MIDRRYQIIRERLSQLPREGLEHVVANIDRVCFDTFNFDEREKTYCPLAMGLGLDSLPSPTNEFIQAELAKVFFPVNALKGVAGKFYTSNRKDDLLALCTELLAR